MIFIVRHIFIETSYMRSSMDFSTCDIMVLSKIFQILEHLKYVVRNSQPVLEYHCLSANSLLHCYLLMNLQFSSMKDSDDYYEKYCIVHVCP